METVHVGNRPREAKRGTIIRIENMTKTYGKIQALCGMDLRVAAGELFAYLGPNGADKTSTIRILTGLTRLSSVPVSFPHPRSPPWATSFAERTNH